MAVPLLDFRIGYYGSGRTALISGKTDMGLLGRNTMSCNYGFVPMDESLELALQPIQPSLAGNQAALYFFGDEESGEVGDDFEEKDDFEDLDEEENFEEEDDDFDDDLDDDDDDDDDFDDDSDEAENDYDYNDDADFDDLDE